jgi:Protein of unknown function (DUF3017)
VNAERASTSGVHSGPRQSRDLRNAPFWLVLVIELAGVAYTGLSPQHWLRGVGVMSIGLLIGGIARLTLTNEQAGLLRVRGRAFDVLCYIGFGVLAIVFGLALPGR